MGRRDGGGKTLTVRGGLLYGPCRITLDQAPRHHLRALRRRHPARRRNLPLNPLDRAMKTREPQKAFSFVLDHKPGFFLSRFFYRLFQRVQLDQAMVPELKQMHRAGTVVYTIKYRGILDYLLFHYRFRNPI